MPAQVRIGNSRVRVVHAMPGFLGVISENGTLGRYSCDIGESRVIRQTAFLEFRVAEVSMTEESAVRSTSAEDSWLSLPPTGLGAPFVGPARLIAVRPPQCARLLTPCWVLLTGENETAATLGSYTITLEERRGIPQLDLGETRGSQHIVDLICRPADFFHSLSVAAPETALSYEPLAITPSL